MNEKKVAKVLVNGKVFAVPLKKAKDGTLMPSISIEVTPSNVTRYVPGNFPWKWYNRSR